MLDVWDPCLTSPLAHCRSAGKPAQFTTNTTRGFISLMNGPFSGRMQVNFLLFESCSAAWWVKLLPLIVAYWLIDKLFEVLLALHIARHLDSLKICWVHTHTHTHHRVFSCACDCNPANKRMINIFHLSGCLERRVTQPDWVTIRRVEGDQHTAADFLFVQDVTPASTELAYEVSCTLVKLCFWFFGGRCPGGQIRHLSKVMDSLAYKKLKL